MRLTAVRPASAPPLAVARLRYAYADALLEAGKDSEARHWFTAAAKLDHDQETDAQERVDALDGILIDYDQDGEDESSDEPPQESQ